ncbi:prefoldin subunit 6 [Pseudozyma hubeiensis SY62]|uniref:Prefoldin subunit 6 n=1 Tax=Pseudozyma hubeiensis (strain SY62) TaxID=1305764 RepID=R9PC67_PSEHS|nr:prefoldin subunit 6 [Pseudozyma hubeiensis SY62]GAC98966.1 prefoldin subunit 6 [Pseudozyma hubeiensis SY62]
MEAAITQYQKLQASFQTAVEARQQLDSQLRENEQVAKEFSRLKQDNQVYKLIGPVLVKQDQVEAKTNVDKRIEFIKGEISWHFKARLSKRQQHRLHQQSQLETLRRCIFVH